MLFQEATEAPLASSGDGERGPWPSPQVCSGRATGGLRTKAGFTHKETIVASGPPAAQGQGPAPRCRPVILLPLVPGGPSSPAQVVGGCAPPHARKFKLPQASHLQGEAPTQPSSLSPCPRGKLGPRPGGARAGIPGEGRPPAWPTLGDSGAPQRAGSAKPGEQRPGEDINQPPDHISCSERSCKTWGKIDLSEGQMGSDTGRQPRARRPSTLGVPPAPSAPTLPAPPPPPARGRALVAWAAPSRSQAWGRGDGSPRRPWGAGSSPPPRAPQDQAQPPRALRL